MLDHLPWDRIIDDLNRRGFAVTDPVLSPDQCREIVGWYDEDAPFRSRVEMARFGFGEGAYKYFADPLPDPVSTLRSRLYGALRDTANHWRDRLGQAPNLPQTHETYLEQCRAEGQHKPTCLLLRYEAGGYNRLHQDLYGALNFPFQAAFLLSVPGQDFTGGEFVLTEQKPRSQSRAHVVPLQKGSAVIFAVNDRPVSGTRGDYRVKMRHGVSEVTSGRRHCLGIIPHLAQ